MEYKFVDKNEKDIKVGARVLSGSGRAGKVIELHEDSKTDPDLVSIGYEQGGVEIWPGRVCEILTPPKEKKEAKKSKSADNGTSGKVASDSGKAN